MAIASPVHHYMTLGGFKNLLKKFDANGDGRICEEELREAIRATGGWFSTARAHRMLNLADANSNGFVDEDEIVRLVEFAVEKLGYKIVARYTKKIVRK